MQLLGLIILTALNLSMLTLFFESQIKSNNLSSKSSMPDAIRSLKEIEEEYNFDLRSKVKNFMFPLT